MPDFPLQFFSRLAVMLPVILLLVALFWYLFNKRRLPTGAAFNPADMRSWPLRFALADAVVFAISFALISAWMADSQFGAGVAGAVSALVAIGVMPWLAVRYPKLFSK